MDDDSSLLNKLDSAVPAPLAKFDAFPKLPSTYKTRTESRGFMTIFVILLAFLLMLNDIGEYIWGWPDFEFSVDDNKSSFLDINVDLVVNMPCKFISVDLRDAMGDRLYLSGGLRRDGTVFDVGQATALKEHSEALSARQAISQSRKSRGLFANLFRRNKSNFKPTYDYQPHGDACRVWGSLQVKRVTANLHITTLGHGYASYEHVDHNQMNLSHVITEFSFGPHFPDITQPLDNSFESTDERFVAYQYFLHVVPTTYIAPRSAPLQTHQYSVTHYTRIMQHNQGTPGIFFKFDLDPLAITQHQRTTTFLQLLIRCVGVIGGVFVCMGYAIRITTRAVEVVSGADQTPGIVAAEASGAKVGLRSKWGGSELRARPKSGKMVPQGSGWVLEGSSTSPYASYANTPHTGGFPGTPAPLPPSQGVQSPFAGSAYSHLVPPGSNPVSPNPSVLAGHGAGIGLGFPSSPGSIRGSASLGPPPRSTSGGASPVGIGRSPSMGEYEGLTPSYAHFPPSPNPAISTNGNGSGDASHPPRPTFVGPKKDD
ncbi:hypothetical protein K443DRAFT_677094 [Laccaria amethystina LaAM-08-1]|uniref:DUF1692-domain-containing protein n=1 Tax=Laccaria amethystina LaAM-08-1 TaxID=1095629 RepID=A0A0C9XDL2_9AGAR|nr:hypothetical protein K443DRAFT_677094 [Laccaria amethystina LaAM-08-1]